MCSFFTLLTTGVVLFPLFCTWDGMARRTDRLVEGYNLLCLDKFDELGLSLGKLHTLLNLKDGIDKDPGLG